MPAKKSPKTQADASLWQRFYGGVLALRRQRAQRTAQRLPRPVISVGNLHWGGGGKTPITAAIADNLLARGKKVTVLSRGHGRKSKGPLIVSNGGGSMVSVEDSGDEPAILARTPGLGVVVGERRYQAGVLALEYLPTDLFLLDDGFSHVSLHRDVELLLFPSSEPFAGGKLLPTGRLREPLTAARHAHALILTGQECDEGSSELNSQAIAAFTSTMQTHGWVGPVFGATAHGSIAPPRPIKNALLVCAVARPENVERTVRNLAATHRFELTDILKFRDHHDFPARSLRQIEDAAQRVDTVIVTAKDLVKLTGRLQLRGDCQLVEIRHQAQPQKKFFDWLDDRLRGLLNS